jgi:hypothetical protein
LKAYPADSCKIAAKPMIKLPFQASFVGRGQIWSKDGVGEAAKVLLQARTTLFDSLSKHISEYPDMKQMLYTMLFQGEQIAYNEDNHTIEIANMFGYISCDNMSIKIANRIFETRLYNMFLSEAKF